MNAISVRSRFKKMTKSVFHHLLLQFEHCEQVSVPRPPARDLKSEGEKYESEYKSYKR